MRITQIIKMLLADGPIDTRYGEFSFSGIPNDEIGFEGVASQVDRARWIQYGPGGAFESPHYANRFEERLDRTPPCLDKI